MSENVQKSFKGQKSCGNNKQVLAANHFVTSDATGTPLESPLAYSNSVITIEVPTDAVELILKPTTDLRVSEVVGMGTYYMIDEGSAEVFGVADMDKVYIVRDSADGVVNFRFNTL